MEGEALLDDAELLRRVYHLLHIVCEVLGRANGRAGGCHGEAHRTIVHPHAVADLAAEQLVHRRTHGLAGNVPQRHFNRTDCTAPRLEAAQAADIEHHPLDVSRVLVEDAIFVEQHVGLEVGLALLDFPEPVDALVGIDAHNRVVADNRTFEIRDFHIFPFLCSMNLSVTTSR